MIRSLSCWLAIGLFLVPQAAAIDENEPNDTCLQGEDNPASPGGAYHYGSLDASDRFDHWLVANANEGQVITIQMNPGYSAGADFDLVLKDWQCDWITASQHPGSAIETITATAPYTGTYTVYLYQVAGGGYYDFWLTIDSPEPEPEPCDFDNLPIIDDQLCP